MRCTCILYADRMHTARDDGMILYLKKYPSVLSAGSVACMFPHIAIMGFWRLEGLEPPHIFINNLRLATCQKRSIYSNRTITL